MAAPPVPHALLSDPAFPELREHVVRTTGLSYLATREGELAQRVSARLAELGCDACAAYLRLLRGNPAEQEALVRHLTIGETYFFRFREQWDALREVVLPSIIQRNAGVRRLRVWSAGCSIGPEAYSLSILLQHHFAEALEGWDVEVLGTDLNAEALERAREARYNEWALRSLPAELRAECFMEEGGQWTLRHPYRRGVRFQQHNLVPGPYPPPGIAAPLDLILCRNVMIYFSRETIRHVAERFAACLDARGWLLVGHAEMTAELETPFEVARAGGIIAYRRRGAGPDQGLPRAELATGAGPAPPAVPAGPAPVDWTPYQFPAAPAAPAAPAIAPAGTEPHLPPGPPAQPAPPGLAEMRALADQGDWPGAVEYGERLLRAEPLNAEAHFYFALVCVAAGDQAAAEQSFRRAIYLQRGHALAHYHLGLLLLDRGDQPGARRSLENALKKIAQLPDHELLNGGELTAGELRRALKAQTERLRSP